MKYIDAHNHLHSERLSPRIDEVLSECRRVGVIASVVNGTSPADWDAVTHLTSKHSWLIPSYGCHPWFLDCLPSDWEARLQRALDQRPAGLGEIGLDGWKPGNDLKFQEWVFERQLAIAAERNIPVTIHGLKAWERLYGVLSKSKRPAVGFLLHSYSGPLRLALKFAELGAYFSCSGAFLAETRNIKLSLFKDLPSERILAETDAPDQLPPKHLDAYGLTDSDGARATHPASISAVYNTLGDVLGLSRESLEERLAANFYRLFASVASRGA